MTLSLVTAALLLMAADAPVEAAAPSKKPRKEVVVTDGLKVEGDTKRAVQIVIPRDRSVTKDIDSTSDHLLQSTQRR